MTSGARVRRSVVVLLGVALVAASMAAHAATPGPAAAADARARSIPKAAVGATARDILRGGLAMVTADVKAGRAPDVSGLISRERGGRTEIAVTVEVRAGAAARVASALRRNRATIANIDERAVEGYLPATALESAAAVGGVVAIRPIYRRVHGGFVTPAIDIPGAPAWHSAGATGSGIRVGVLDGGFEGVRALLGAELPASTVVRCYTDIGLFTSDPADCENGEGHGSAVAELVADMAPGAQLYLANPESAIDYRDTIRWMTSEGVRILNSSASSGWLFDGPGDGTPGRPDSTYEEVDLGVELGALWVNSAGNEGDTGWSGPWRDADADDILEWSGADESNTIRLEAGQGIRVAMRWPDEWGAATNDYDIALFLGDTPVAIGSDFQDGGGDPFEIFDFVAPATDNYDLLIQRFDAEPAERIQVLIFTTGPLAIEYRVESGTLPSPADSANPGMVTVGAVQLDSPDLIEPYSSRGPTVDGRTKPDLVAPDCMATITYGMFCGTSASAPMTAGAGAVLLGADPTQGAVELAATLRARAVALGEPAPNSVFGHGRLALGALPEAPPRTTAVSLRASTSSVTWPGEVTLTATLAPAIPPGRVIQFQSSTDGRVWTTIGSAASESGRSASLRRAPLTTRLYRAVALGTAVTSGAIRVAVRQRLTVRPSPAPPPAGARRIAAGTAVTFEALVRPARSGVPRASVEFVIYHRLGGAWVLERRLEVAADSAGTAVVPLQFDLPGQWYVRARALPTAGASASAWSQTFRYDVAGTATGSLVRSWHAALRDGGATIASYSGGTSVLELTVAGLAPGGRAAIAVVRGSCDTGPAGARVAALPSARAGSDGALRSVTSLSTAQAAAIARVALTGEALSLRVVAGAVTRCAPLIARPIPVTRIATGEEASGVAVDGAAVWVTNIFADTVSRIDPASDVVTDTIAVPAYPGAIASDGRTLWVTHVGTGMLTRIDAATGLVLDTEPVGPLPGNLALGGGFVWVVIQGDDEVAKIDARTNEIVDRIPVAAGPYGIAYADGSVWVSSAGDGIVTRIDATTDEVVTQIEVPDVLDLTVSGGQVWASVRPARAAAGAVVRIEAASGEVVARVAVGFEPAGLAAVGGALYVAMAGEPTLVQVRGDRVIGRVDLGMKSVALVSGFRSLWVLHPYGTGIPGSGLFDGGVTRLNV